MEHHKGREPVPPQGTDSAAMRLESVNDSRLRTLIGWFDSQQDMARWGGPTMRWPITMRTLKEDARIPDLASFFLVDDDSILGFGQFYRRLDRCHLGRLAIAPDFRGQRLGQTLIEQLAQRGNRTLATDSESLFVLEDNRPAIRLYERCGFSETRYPGDDLDLAHITYMIREAGS